MYAKHDILNLKTTGGVFCSVPKLVPGRKRIARSVAKLYTIILALVSSPHTISSADINYSFTGS